MANGRYSSANAPIAQVHVNTSQEIIQVTDDKLRLILSCHLDVMEKRKDWIAPLGLVIAVITVFVSSEFKDALGLDAATWRAIFILSGLASGVWLVYTLVVAWRSPSLDDVVRAIKNSGGNV
jgi:hypothetical protein